MESTITAISTSAHQDHASKKNNPLHFPMDCQKILSPRNEAEYRSFLISQKLRYRIQDMSQQENVPLSTVLLSGFLILLRHYTNQEEITIGLQLDSKNVKVLNTTAQWDLTFERFLVQITESFLGESETVSIQESNLAILFTFQNDPLEPSKIDECIAHNHDLELDFHVTESTLNGVFRFRKGSFSHQSIQLLVKHLLNILESVVENPQKPIGDVNIIDEEECYKLLKTWNNTTTDIQDVTMIDLFSGHVSRNPGRLAVIYGDEELSYGELDNRSNVLANYLRQLGVEHEVLVAVCMDRSPRLIISFLAILKAGGAYLPLDPTYPAERLDFMVRDSRCPIILTDMLSNELFTLAKAKVVCINRDWEKIETKENTEALVNITTPTSLAYVMYTSGSTGVPKGVLIEQKSIIRLVYNTNYFQATANDKITQIVNTSFDLSALEIWSTLLNGATLVCISRASTLNLVSLESEIARHSVTVIFLPTALFNQIMTSRPTLLCHLNHVMFGGEAANPKLVQKFLDMQPHGQLLNLYGITEVTVCSTWFEIKESSNRIPIGLPISNSRAYVLNHKQQLVPTGVVGELYLAGDGLARGYLHRPEDRFIVNPNPEFQNERMFRTGDLVRRRYDGNLEYLGRTDGMVKIRGHRIELTEVQNVILQHTTVKDCVVTAIGDSPSGKRLVAYVTRSDVSNLKEELVSECEKAYDEHVYGNCDQQVSEPAFNATGWINTYNGEPIPSQEMHEWLEETVNSIKRLNPKRVLEIGCGTGMVLFKIAPHCESYIATDLSEAALKYVQQYLNTPELKKVQLNHGGAHELERFSAGQFDTVILNSVVQHFPDEQYLSKVLENLVQLVRPGGHIFIGDIRGMTLAKYHYVSQAMYDAKESSQIYELREYMDRKEFKDKELLLDPGYFKGLKELNGEIEHVQIMPKRSCSLNEMTKFRYQVILHIKCFQTPTQLPEWFDWQLHQLSLGTIQEKLCEADVSYLGICNIPNKRLAKEIQFQTLLDENSPDKRTYGELQQRLHTNEFSGATPDELEVLAKEIGYVTEISWAQHKDGGIYDIIFCRTRDNNSCISFKMPEYTGPNHKCYNNPLHRKLQQLAPELEKFMRTKLPDYMIPPSIVVMDKLPLTENGKINYNALPAPTTTIWSIASNCVAPRTNLEVTLTGIMRKVLGMEHFGIHDTFLSLGGDSISAIEMAALCQKEGIQISSLNFFKNPTVAMLAEYIRASNGVESIFAKSHGLNSPKSIPLQPFELLNVEPSQMERIWETDILGNEIQKHHVEDIYPCVPLQSHLVYETTLDKKAELHYVFYDIQGSLDIERLQDSCAKLCQENTMLRTVFVVSGAGVAHLNFIQIVIKKEHFHILFKVYHCASPEEKEHTIEKHLAEEQGIQLGKNMLRFALFTDKSKDHRFLWTIHHALMDGWTMQLLLNDLIETYECGNSPERPQYRSFVQSYLNRDHLADKEFWKRKLWRVNKELLPRQLKQEITVMVEPSVIVCSVTKNIPNFCKEHGVTSAALFKAAWVATVGLYARATEVIFGDVVFGRNMELNGADRIIGPCFNVLPVRIRLTKDERFLNLVYRVQVEQNSNQPFENTNIGEIISMFSDEREMHKIYGSYVAFQNFRSQLHKSSFASQISFAGMRGSIHLTIILEGIPVENGLDMKLTFDPSILSEVDANNHMQLLCSCMQYIVDHPHDTLGMLEASLFNNAHT